MIDDMQARNLSPATQKNYIHYVYELAKFFMRSPDDLEPGDIKKFQMHLLHERKLSAQSVNQSISAMKFLFNTTLEKNWANQKFPRVRPPETLPEILSQNEAVHFFAHVPSMKYRTALMVSYGAGLRVSDTVKLTRADIDADRMTIRIQQGKGNKDRYALLSPRVLEIIQAWQEKLDPNMRWLFPSWMRRDKHISTGALGNACKAQRAQRLGSIFQEQKSCMPLALRFARVPKRCALPIGYSENHHRPYPAPQLRHSSVGKWDRYSSDPVLAGTQTDQYNRALHSRLQHDHAQYPRPS